MLFSIPIIAAAGAGVLALLGICIAYWVFLQKRKREKYDREVRWLPGRSLRAHALLTRRNDRQLAQPRTQQTTTD